MPYEDDYKAWLEKSLIEMNPDWICDGMADKEFTHDWCGKYCGTDSDYMTPKCLHLYYHHIVRAEQTEPQKNNLKEAKDLLIEWKHKHDELFGRAEQTDCAWK